MSLLGGKLLPQMNCRVTPMVAVTEPTAGHKSSIKCRREALREKHLHWASAALQSFCSRRIFICWQIVPPFVSPPPPRLILNYVCLPFCLPLSSFGCCCKDILICIMLVRHVIQTHKNVSWRRMINRRRRNVINFIKYVALVTPFYLSCFLVLLIVDSILTVFLVQDGVRQVLWPPAGC